ncbi:hypothetical protein BDZ94DRAFT_1261260 [Collybia nuda]|uniref:Transmembrane protein n=1 Tax=Collybia nuda TaxID=64659 RepID=A0A9P6CE26_9AGAR|nr:hypothetical protein BDZ94DRAFT_1261260 [Collybia nuda]
MIKQTPTDPTTAPEVSPLGMPTPCPSPPLVLLNILSCFLATAAFMTSLTQINSWVPWIMAILPPTIGFLATTPFHLFLYWFVRRHAEKARKDMLSGDTSFLPMWCFVYIFLLVALWIVILILDIMCCVGGGSLGVVITTIFVGLECIVCALLAIKCVLEIWDVEDMSNRFKNRPNPSGPDAEANLASDDTIYSGSAVDARPTPKYLYLASWILATLAFLASISPWFTLIADIPIYIFTVIVHVPMFISSGSSRGSNTPFRLGNAGVSFLLVILWCTFVLINILGDILVFQRVLAGLFGMLECVVVAYIAIQHIIETISPAQGRVRLE